MGTAVAASAALASGGCHRPRLYGLFDVAYLSRGLWHAEVCTECGRRGRGGRGRVGKKAVGLVVCLLYWVGRRRAASRLQKGSVLFLRQKTVLSKKQPRTLPHTYLLNAHCCSLL